MFFIHVSFKDLQIKFFIKNYRYLLYKRLLIHILQAFLLYGVFDKIFLKSYRYFMHMLFIHISFIELSIKNCMKVIDILCNINYENVFLTQFSFQFKFLFTIILEKFIENIFFFTKMYLETISYKKLSISFFHSFFVN